MLRAVEAIIEPDGTIRPLEPLQVEEATRAIVTLLAPFPSDLPSNITEGGAQFPKKLES